MRIFFARFASAVSTAAGSSWAFILALGIVIVWGVSGPIFAFSDTWQLVINTGTTIVTFLMVFLIQNTQNRDTRAMHLKLDELLRAVEGAREDRFIDLELEDEKKVEEIHRELEAECGVCQTLDEHKRHPEQHKHRPEERKRPRSAKQRSMAASR
jgi:low affinity Fe/Cu permease